MGKYTWLFPIIFIIHDMEEIIGLGIWLKKNNEILKEKYPSIIAQYHDFSTEGFSLAVFEELLLCVLISLLALLTDSAMIWYIWLGGFIGCVLHFVIHIGQTIILKKYIPAVATSILLFPISVHIIYECFLELQGNVYSMMIGIIIGIAIVVVNLKLIQKLIGRFTRKMKLPPIV